MTLHLNLIQLGQQLFHARQEVEYSVEDVAGFLEIDSFILVGAEAGEYQLTAHQLIRLSRLYQQPMSRFVGEPLKSCETEAEIKTAIRSYHHGLLTEGQLMELLRVDRIKVRELIEKTQARFPALPG